jgi:hypothetical protein
LIPRRAQFSACHAQIVLWRTSGLPTDGRDSTSRCARTRHVRGRGTHSTNAGTARAQFLQYGNSASRVQIVHVQSRPPRHRAELSAGTSFAS